MPTFNKTRGFELKSGNSPLFENIGSSPVKHMFGNKGSGQGKKQGGGTTDFQNKVTKDDNRNAKLQNHNQKHRESNATTGHFGKKKVDKKVDKKEEVTPKKVDKKVEKVVTKKTEPKVHGSEYKRNQDIYNTVEVTKVK